MTENDNNMCVLKHPFDLKGLPYNHEMLLFKVMMLFNRSFYGYEFKDLMRSINSYHYTKNGDSNLTKNEEFRYDVAALMERVYDTSNNKFRMFV